jgi:hypothetical protein
MREARENAEENQNEKPKVQVSLGEAMKDLGV